MRKTLTVESTLHTELIKLKVVMQEQRVNQHNTQRVTHDTVIEKLLDAYKLLPTVKQVLTLTANVINAVCEDKSATVSKVYIEQVEGLLKDVTKTLSV